MLFVKKGFIFPLPFAMNGMSIIAYEVFRKTWPGTWSCSCFSQMLKNAPVIIGENIIELFLL